jgi:hypothetical protein
LYANYFCNTLLLKDGATTPIGWNYAGDARYWPPDTREKVSFFIYAPCTPASPNLDLQPASGSLAGLPTLTYTVPDDPAGQIDLVYDARLDQSRSISDDLRVKFQLKHALSAVSIEAKLDAGEQPASGKDYTAIITGLQLTNIYKKGTLDWLTGAWSFDPGSPAAAMDCSAGLDGALTFETNDNPTPSYYYRPALSSAAGSLMLLPQSHDNIQLLLTITFTPNGVLQKTIPLGAGEWEASKHYIYQINIKISEFATP